MRVRWRIWVPILALLFAVGAGWAALAAFERAMVGPRHEFSLTDRPPFLTEELAIAHARAALSRDVPDPTAWQANPDGRTMAPDGRRDEYLSRNGLNPNLGSVTFRGPDGQRCVSVELAGDCIVCQSSRGK